MTDRHLTPEFSVSVDIREIGNAPVQLCANAQQRAALAQRFGIVSISRLEAAITLVPDGREITANGTFEAEFIQNCAISGDDLPMSVREEIALRFVPGRDIADEELELNAADLDEMSYEGTAFDLGEAVAQSFAVAIDPYATGPDADTVRDRHDLGEKGPDGPLQQALKGLKKD